MQTIIETNSLRAWRAAEMERAIREGRAVIRNHGCSVNVYPTVEAAQEGLRTLHNPTIGPSDGTAFLTMARH